MTTPGPAASTIEAKIVVLGSQGVGKTSLVHRYVKNAFIPPAKAQSTVGASFLTSKVHEPESGTTIRLQIWDTAGQERFRSISKLYYRGAQAAILCYDVTSLYSFEEMGRWLTELREQCGSNDSLGDMIIHVVGTKSDVVAADPTKREVNFERCVKYVEEQLRVPGSIRKASIGQIPGSAHGISAAASPNSNHGSGFWGTETVWDCCHEVSSKDGEGIEEVFRVITRKLVEQHIKRLEESASASKTKTPGLEGAGQQGYFDLTNGGSGSFRLGYGDKRRSWLGFPTTPGGLTSIAGGTDDGTEHGRSERRGCC